MTYVSWSQSILRWHISDSRTKLPVISDHLLKWYPNFGTPQFSGIPNDHQLRSGNEVLLPSWFFWCRSASRFVSMWSHSLPTVRQGPHIRPEKLVSACSTRALPVKVSEIGKITDLSLIFLFRYVGEWHCYENVYCHDYSVWIVIIMLYELYVYLLSLIVYC